MRNLWLQLKNFIINLWAGIKLIPKLRRSQVPQLLETFSKKEIYAIASAMLILALSGGFLLVKFVSSKGPGPHYGGELTEGVVGQPQFINPVLAPSNGVDMDLSRLVFAQLLKFDETGNLTGDLAQGLPDVSPDQKTFTIKLKPNLKWQDGKPITADDIEFTIQTIQNPDFESPLRPNWARVKIQKVDDLTITFTLREASNTFIDNFALGIIPKHVWQGLSAGNFRLSDNNLKAVGSGPFSVREIKKTSDGTIKSITLLSNDQYYQGAPYLSGITFKFYSDYDSLINAYQGKDIQSLGFIPFDRKSISSNPDKISQYNFSLPQYQSVFFNLKNAVLSEKAVRQALWLATDRSTIINDAYSGNAVPAFGPILPDNPGYNPSIEKSVHFNLQEASGILDKAGWVLDPATNLRIKNKKTLEFNLAVAGNLVLNVKTAQIIQTEWSKLGVKINLVIVGPAELEQDYIKTRGFDALLFSENIGADEDPFPFWHSSQSHDPGLNISGFSNAEADKLLTEARQTSDLNLKNKDYQRFQEIVNDQLPAIFLVQTVYIYNAPKKLQGIDLKSLIHPSERFLDANKWYFGN